MRNYRKAKKGEVTCEECVHSLEPQWFSNRIRCGCGNGFGRGPRYAYAVGRKNTCDSARREKGGTAATEESGVASAVGESTQPTSAGVPTAVRKERLLREAKALREVADALFRKYIRRAERLEAEAAQLPGD